MPTLLLSRWFWVGLVIAALGAWGGYGHLRVQTLTAEKLTLQNENTVLSSFNDSCTKNVLESNQAVEKLKELSKELSRNAEAALESLQATQASREAEIARLKALSRAKPVGKTCEDALLQIRGK